MIRHAWHFYYALVLVIKVVCGSIVLRASHLNWALYECVRTQVSGRAPSMLTQISI
ncbi:DUF3265 domain-containing protein [Vibrio alginolyticus]|nr:DUF3265 domain-containing protein [Vibrio alginolyticus]ELA7821781.1 DUF3265 domain-containing protein [Vibrio alginolyticus]ELI1598889.1 DUF3265 domain-containing protein [Vibrio alginolyticus]EMC8465208.1 DUF3265 domain-containing protein [Vibrio alginolyticus]EME3939184.1 DUF3265 domain-containing protein [Vibrio alginolyticus]